MLWWSQFSCFGCPSFPAFLQEAKILNVLRHTYCSSHLRSKGVLNLSLNRCAPAHFQLLWFRLRPKAARQLFWNCWVSKTWRYLAFANPFILLLLGGWLIAVRQFEIHMLFLFTCFACHRKADEKEPEQIDERVQSVYKGVGQVMRRFTTGKVPKAFKIIPQLRNWEEVGIPQKLSAIQSHKGDLV